jgi:L-rhamnose-H+ transport protein
MIWGLLLAVASGVAFGIFLAPLRIIKAWQWENVWAIWCLIGTLVGPVLFAAWTVPHYFELNKFIGGPALLLTVFLGAIAGTSGFLYAVTVPAIGLGLATALNSGTCMAMSLVPLAVLHRGSILHRGGLLTIGGVALSIVGITLCGKGGHLRESELKKNDLNRFCTEASRIPPRLSFVKSVVFCCLAGAITSAFNLALAFPNPVIKAALRFGVSGFAASSTFTAPWLVGGAISNAMYVAWRLRQNNSLQCFRAPGWFSSALWSVLLAIGFLFGMYTYTGSVFLMGIFGGVIAWGVSMAAMILASALWDMYVDTWTGAAAQSMVYGIEILMTAILALSFAQYFFQRDGS